MLLSSLDDEIPVTANFNLSQLTLVKILLQGLWLFFFFIPKVLLFLKLLGRLWHDLEGQAEVIQKFISEKSGIKIADCWTALLYVDWWNLYSSLSSRIVLLPQICSNCPRHRTKRKHGIIQNKIYYGIFCTMKLFQAYLGHIIKIISFLTWSVISYL